MRLPPPSLPGVLALAAACALAVAGCVPRHPRPPEVLSEAECRQTIDGSFGSQDAAVIAARPLRGGTVFTPEALAALHRVTQRAQRDAATDQPAVLSLTSATLMRPVPRGVELFRIGEQLPETRAAADALRPLVYSYELVVDNLVNVPGTAAYVHLPRVLYPGYDLRGLLTELRRQELETLLIALDDGDPAFKEEYREVAGGSGPSADHVSVLFQAEQADGMKEPRNLKAVLEFQRFAEQLAGVAQSYSVTDDIMLARRYLFRGSPAEARIPDRRAAVSQALLAWSLSGNAEAMGTRLSSDERVALVRVGLRVLEKDGAREKLVEDLRHLAASMAARTGMRGVVCP